MSYLDKHVGLYTDQYELAMIQAHYLKGRKDIQATFDYFFRKTPFASSYVIFAGLQDLLAMLEKFRYEEDDLAHLRSTGFHSDFLDYLRNFYFAGTVYAPREGDVVFPNEPVVRVEGYESFEVFADTFPEKCILLVDTYDTLHSGVPNAINVAKKMEQKGQKLFGIRLDSGDLVQLAKESRRMLDEAGLGYVKIVASSELDEHVIEDFLMHDAPIDGFGVGTSLVTGRKDAALDGVYKLCKSGGKPRLKLSENQILISSL